MTHAFSHRLRWRKPLRSAALAPALVLLMAARCFAQNAPPNAAPISPRAGASPAPATSTGNTADQLPPVHALHVEVDLQSLEVQVKDAQGNDVPGLTADDFTILEDGKPQKIAFFDAGSDPASLVVLVDSSGSVSSNGRLGSAQAIAAEFMRTARPGDEISAMDFTSRMGPFQQLTDKQLLNPASVSLAPTASGGSALYDAIADALCHLRVSKNLQQAVVVITDGMDQNSRITLAQLIGLVRTSHAQLFMIDLASKSNFSFSGHAEPKVTLLNGHDIDNPAVVFRQLARESGAEASPPNSERSLKTALKTVTDTLRAQYTLAYYPEDHAKKLRRIDVQVDRRGARAMTRRFVGSDPDDANSVHFDEGSCIVSSKFHTYPYEAKLLLPNGSGGTVLYKEDFSDRKSGWPEHPNSHYVSGGYELSNPQTTTGGLRSNNRVSNSIQTTFLKDVIAAYGPWWADFRASVTVKALPDPEFGGRNAGFPYAGHPAAGLVFRLNLDGYYAMLLSGSTGTKDLAVKLVKRKLQGSSSSYVETELIPWTKIGARSSASGTELAVDVFEDQISIFVDGREIGGAKDDTFDQGYEGFVMSGPGRATFKNLVLERK